MKSAGPQTHETHEMHEIHRPPPKTHETHETHEIHEIRMPPKMQQERLCTHFMQTKSTHILQDGAFLAYLISCFYAFLLSFPTPLVVPSLLRCFSPAPHCAHFFSPSTMLPSSS